MRVRFLSVLAMAASSSTSGGVAALEGGVCARPAAFASAVTESVNRQLAGPIPTAVPSQLHISFKKSCLEQASMIPISTADGAVKELMPVLTTETMVQKHAGEYGSICFVVRRPG
jgi:hypothetical protein